MNQEIQDAVKARMEADRNKWIRLFNRLESAVRSHMDTKKESGFADEADDELHHAYRRVLSDAHKH